MDHVIIISFPGGPGIVTDKLIRLKGIRENVYMFKVVEKTVMGWRRSRDIQGLWYLHLAVDMEEMLINILPMDIILKLIHLMRL